MDRPDLVLIHRRYQVAREENIQYRPKLFGAIEVPVQSVVMTATEGRLLDQLDLKDLFKFKEIHDDAFRESEKRYLEMSVAPEQWSEREKKMWVSNDGHQDAFRHAYWNALLTKEYGEPWTKAFATAHESGPRNPGAREAMDLYNNEVGRKISQDNPGASRERLGDLVGAAIHRGELVVLNDNGQLAWSDQVAIGEHGRARAIPGPEPAGNVDRERVEIEREPHHSESTGAINNTIDNELACQTPRFAAIYTSCSDAVDAIDANLGRASDNASACMKASLTHLAASNGLQRVDHVLLSEPRPGIGAGENVIVVQGDLNDPAHLRAHMPTDQAINTPVETSLRELAQLDQHAQAAQSVLAQQQDELRRRDVHVVGG